MVVDLELTNFSYMIGNGCIGRCHSNLHQIQTSSGILYLSINTTSGHQCHFDVIWCKLE
jgi:hypothetical protein